jgi:hypothetical protein
MTTGLTYYTCTGNSASNRHVPRFVLTRASSIFLEVGLYRKSSPFYNVETKLNKKDRVISDTEYNETGPAII